MHGLARARRSSASGSRLPDPWSSTSTWCGSGRAGDGAGRCAGSTRVMAGGEEIGSLMFRRTAFRSLRSMSGTSAASPRVGAFTLKTESSATVGSGLPPWPVSADPAPAHVRCCAGRPTPIARADAHLCCCCL